MSSRSFIQMTLRGSASRAEDSRGAKPGLYQDDARLPLMTRATVGLLVAVLALAPAPPRQSRLPPPAPPAPAPAPLIAAGALRTLKAREIGPAVMGGRVSDI